MGGSAARVDANPPPASVLPAQGLDFGTKMGYLERSLSRFRISRSGLDYAIDHFRTKNIEFEFQDLIHFHSIFLTDPDGHRVELTAQVKEIV